MFNNRGGNSSGGVNPHLYAQQQQQQQRQNQMHNNNINNNNNNRGNVNSGQNTQNRPRPVQQNVNSQQQHGNHHHNQQRNPQQQGANQQRPSQNQQRPQNQQNNNQPRSNQNQQQQQQQQQPQAPPPPPVLPKGWKKEEIVKTKGILSGLVDIVYGPGPNCEQAAELDGKKFKSKVELQRFLGDKYDMAMLDWKTGKISQAVWRKQRRMKSIAANPNNFASACKYDTYLNIPIRHTSSLVKQPVCCVTNNHRNDPAPANITNPTNNNNNGNNQNKMEKPKPIQLFWELRFNDTKSIDSDLVNTDEFKQEFNLENIPKFKNFELTDETELRSVATACYLNPNKIMLGQDKDFNKNARVFIDRDQPLISAYTVKEEEIKQQEAKLKEMRKQLEQALHEYENFDIDYVEKIEINNANSISGGSDIEATA